MTEHLRAVCANASDGRGRGWTCAARRSVELEKDVTDEGNPYPGFVSFTLADDQGFQTREGGRQRQDGAPHLGGRSRVLQTGERRQGLAAGAVRSGLRARVALVVDHRQSAGGPVDADQDPRPARRRARDSDAAAAAAGASGGLRVRRDRRGGPGAVPLRQAAQRPREPAGRDRSERAAAVDHQRAPRRHPQHLLLGPALSRLRDAGRRSRLVGHHPARQAAHPIAGAGVDLGQPAAARRLHGAVDDRRGGGAQDGHVVAVAGSAPPALVSRAGDGLRRRAAAVGAGGVSLRPGERRDRRCTAARGPVAAHLRGVVSTAPGRASSRSRGRSCAAITVTPERCC